MRLLGKRQLGEMELSEFILAALIADLASLPLQDLGIPMINGLVPIMVLFCCELLIAGLSMKNVRLRSFFSGKPSLLELLMLKNSYQSSNISTEAKNVLGQLIRIGSNGFYNSTDLRNATVQAVLNQITGSKTATSARVPQPTFLQPATSTGVPATTATPGLLQGVHQLLNGQR